MPPRDPIPVEIEIFDPSDEVRLAEAAVVLHAAMVTLSAAWPTPEAALGELVELARIRETLFWIALDPGGKLCGVVGGRPRHVGQTFEMHILAVDPARRRRGVGRALVAALDAGASDRGYRVLYAPVPDESGHSSLAGAGLFPKPLEALGSLTWSEASPLGFFMKLGFAVAGVAPDAHGAGKPEITLARPIAATD